MLYFFHLISEINMQKPRVECLTGLEVSMSGDIVLFLELIGTVAFSV